MSSPLSIFRKYQKVGMAALGVMCMIAFVFLGATGFNTADRPDPAVASTKYGEIKRSELQQFATRGQLANQLIMGLSEMTVRAMVDAKQMPVENAPLALAELQRGFLDQGTLIRLDTDQQIVQEMLWEKKAESLGIEEDDEAINEFIQRLTLEMVPAEEIRAVINQTKASERQAFYALGQRIKAGRAKQLLMLNAVQLTPAMRFDWFRRTRAQATVELLPIHVEQFLAQVPEPTNAQLVQLFDAHKFQPANADSAQPGFFQLERAKFSYFTAQVDDFLKPEEVTEAQIAEYYEANKELFPASPPSSPPSGETTPGGETTPPTTEAGDAASPPPAEPASEPAEPPAAETPSETPPSEPPASEPPASETQPQEPPTPEAGVDGSAQDPPPSDAPAEPAETQPAETQPAETQPATQETPPADKPAELPDGEAPTPEMFAPPEPTAKYKPLAEVSDTIREMLARDQARERIEKTQQKLAAQLRAYLIERATAQSEGAALPKPLDVESMAKENGMTFTATDFLTAQALSETELGQAVIPDHGLVYNYTFQGSHPINQPLRADGGTQQFVFWKTEIRPEFVPKFEEVREQVVETWKRIEARKLAEARAQEQAEAARKDGRPLAEVFAQAEPKPFQVGPFAWLSQRPFDQISLSGAQWRLTQVEGVEKAGPEFMRAVFALGVGDVGVAWNHPQSTVFVARMVSLTPDELVLWEQFAATPEAMYAQVGQGDIFQILRDVNEGLIRDSKLVWQEPEEEDQAATPPAAPADYPNTPL